MEYASKGVAGAGLGLGIAGTALGLLSGGLGNLGWNLGTTPANQVCSENMTVNRYELGQEQKIAKLESEKALLESTIYTNGQLNDLRNYVDGKFSSINNELRDIAVYQATNTATIGCITNQVNALNASIASITRTAVPASAICDFGCNGGC
jgi:hypothetical protein